MGCVKQRGTCVLTSLISPLNDVLHSRLSPIRLPPADPTNRLPKREHNYKRI